MGKSRSRVAWRSGPTVVVLLLMVTLAVIAVITWEAARAARAERASAEAVLRDYAGFAAWEFERGLRQHLEAAMERIIAGRGGERTPGGHPQPAMTGARMRSALCDCDDATLGVEGTFRFDQPAKLWSVSNAAVGAEVRRTVEESFPAAHGRDHPAAVLRVIDTPDGVRVVAWRYEHPSGDQDAMMARGFVARTALLTPLFDAAAKAPLLPPALTSRVASPNVLTLRAATVNGHTLYGPAAHPSQYTGETRTDARLGGLVLSTSIAPDVAPGLVIGGLPRSRLPMLYGLIALATALVGIAVLQLRRQMELMRVRSEFVSGVSHELRTPLAQIRMFAETLALGRVRSADESRRSLEIIVQESQRLSQLVENVLCFARGDRGARAIAPVAVPIRGALTELVDACQPLIRSRRASVRLAIADDCAAQVDPSALRQIVINLLDNALKYGPVGQTVTIGADTRDGVTRVWVDDEGPGVPAQDAARIWEPFWRAPGSAQGGSGIGLSIVRDLAAAHGGNVQVEPSPARGARFVVSLPAANAGAAAPVSVRDALQRPA